MTPTARELFGTRRIAPSILSADFSKLGEQVAEVMDAGARVIHVDVMDGHFVPPITIGPLIASSIADDVHSAGGVLDVHLMIERPAEQVDFFAAAGADCITIHLEADPHAHRTLAAIRDAGCLAGLAINPGTPAEAVAGLAAECDLMLAMSVNPGWGGQSFIEASLGKARAPARARAERVRGRGRRRRGREHRAQGRRGWRRACSWRARPCSGMRTRPRRISG